MEKIKLSLVLALIAVVSTMTSCVKEQSSLDFGDFPVATIIGNVTYSDGYRAEPGKTSTTEAKGLAIHFTVNNNSYSANNSGTTTFTTRTNEKGNFKIIIPCTVNGISATVTTDDFEGLYYKAPGSLTYAIYKHQAQTINNITPNSIKTCSLSNFTYTPDPTVK